MNELLFYGGPILTMQAEKDGPDARTQALLVRDGRIAALGTPEELRTACPTAKGIDLQGCCLLPAFIDPHSHLLQFASTLQFACLSECRTFDAIRKALLDFIAQNPTGPIIGFGYDQNILAEGVHPSRQLLDQVSADRPIMISHASGHMGVANSAMLRQLGLTDDTPDPQGGRYGRDAQGHLNGLLEENGFIQQPQNAVPVTDPEAQLARQVELLKKAQDIYFSYGITTTQEGLLKQGDLAVYLRAVQEHSLKIDVVGYADIRNCPELPDEYPQYREKYQDHFKIGGYKLFLDGSPQGRTAWMLEDYADEPGYRGYPVYTDEQVRGYVKKAQEENLQLLCHCNGDAAAQQFIQCHKAPSTKRDVMIHAQLLHADQMPAMKAAGIMPSFFTAHSWYWGDAHIQHMGMERAKNISAAASAAALGIPYTFHMDTPVLPPDCIDTLFCAVNRVTRSGVQLNPAEALSAYDALKGVTRYAAWQYFEEDEKGTLAPGKAADLVILSADPTAVAPADLRSIQVLATLKNGETVYQKA